MPSWGFELVEREGLLFKKFTDIPFTGNVNTNIQKGFVKNGKREDYWNFFHSNTGQLSGKGIYKNGNFDGIWMFYWDNGQLRDKGNYKDGNREGSWIGYWENSKLRYEGDYKKGTKDGLWHWYNKDGTVDKEITGTYKEGVKVTN